MLRTSIVLAVIASALLSYILVFERGTLSSRELEQRKGSILPELVRDRVRKIEIQRKNVVTVLERDPDADLDADPSAGLWQVSAPYTAEADQDVVDGLLGELEWLDARRRLEGLSDEDRERFGFRTPRYRVWFTAGDRRVPVIVGNPTPTGDGVYLRGSSEDVAFVVGTDLARALDHEPEHYHEKELHDGGLAFTTTALALRDSEGERAVRKGDDGLWRFERGAQGLASEPAIDELVNALDALRAERFVTDQPGELARYGFSDPSLEIQLEMTELSETAKDDQGEPRRETKRMRLRVGSACEDHPGERYLVVDDGPTLTCIAEEDVRTLRKSVSDLRETRLLPIADAEIRGIRLERDGRTLELTKTEDAWSVVARAPGRDPLEATAREQAVTDWLASLRAVEAERFGAGSAELAAPALELRVARGADRPAYELRAQAGGGAELLARRADEPEAVTFPASALELLEPEAARFRGRELRDGTGALQRLVIERAASVEQIERTAESEAFRVRAPLDLPADPVRVHELARLLGAFEAVRFAADAQAPEHGLSDAPIAVTAEFAAGAKTDDASDPERLALRLGASVPEGRYATLEGVRGVFVVGTRLLDLLSAPLVSRTLLSTPLEQIERIEVARGAAQVRITRTEQGFEAVPEPASPGLGAEVAEALATLRAADVTGYGEPESGQGLTRPYARIEVTTTAGTSHTISIGAETEDGRFARRDDRAATFVLPQAAIDALLAALR